MDSDGMLSEETIDLCESQESSSVEDLSLDKSSLDLLDFDQKCSFEYSRKAITEILSKRTCTSEYSSNNEKSSSSLSNDLNSKYSCHSVTSSGISDGEVTTPGQSFFDTYFSGACEPSIGTVTISEEKLKSYKIIFDKVNDAFVNYKVREFMLETVKSMPGAWAQQLKEITKIAAVKEKINLISRSGESFNLLGLREDDVKLAASRSLCAFNKSAFYDYASAVLKSNVAKLKAEKNALQNDFGECCIKVMEGVMSKERADQIQLYQELHDQRQQAYQLIQSCEEMKEQIKVMQNVHSTQLQKATFSLLQVKAALLNKKTSILKERMDLQMDVDEKTCQAMNTLGDELKLSVSDLREELKTLQKSLLEYQRKEESSAKFREVITEYAKLKTQLNYKKQTLIILNDPDFNTG